MLKLENIIKTKIEGHGPITFAEFMNDALYHPKYGYYMQDFDIIGRAGDFYTAPAASPLFAAMLARQLNDIWVQTGAPDSFAVIEFGAGTGRMASGIISSVKENFCDFDRALQYNIIETSPAMIARQKQEFQKTGISLDEIAWHKGVETCEANNSACVLSNEFVDALPFHRVQNIGGRLREIYVVVRNDKFYAEPGELSTPELAQYFRDQNTVLEEGQYAEVNLQALSWLAEINANLAVGFIMTIDYGYEAPVLYDGFRAEGTMRCFKNHRISADPYELPGSQDITASVNFTALMQKGEQMGWKTYGLVSQQEFLLNLGIMDFLKDVTPFAYDRETFKITQGVKQLIMPEGMGLVFKVLVQGRGADHVRLLGLTRRSEPRGRR